MSKSILLTLGRLPKGLDLARSLHQAGHTIIVADPFGAHICKASNAVLRSYKTTSPNTDLRAYFSQILDIVHQERIDWIIPVSQEALYVTQLAPHLPEAVTLFSEPFETLRALHDSYQFITTATDFGLAAPETALAHSKDAANIATSHDYVIKPLYGRAAKKIRECTRGDPLYIGGMDTPHLVQRRLKGRYIRTQIIALQGKDLGTVTYEGTDASGATATCFKRVDSDPVVTNWIQQFIHHSGYSGFIGFDVIIENGLAYAIQCTPGLTSGIHFFTPASIAQAVGTLADHFEYPPRDNADCKDIAPGSSTTRPTMELSPHAKLQEGYSTLVQLCASVFNPKAFIRRMGELFSARDVLWHAKDPMPFIAMAPLSWNILQQVLFKRHSFSEAVTRDIAWNDHSISISHDRESPKAIASTPESYAPDSLDDFNQNKEQHRKFAHGT